MSEILTRYEKLRLREYEIGTYYYPLICKELSLILRRAYTKLPKNVQSILLEDILAAFRFLPQMKMHSGMVAANLLLQAAEVALPKHKKVLAVKEFKQSVVAHKRRLKSQKDLEGSAQLPEDVLVRIFSLLDMHSLVDVGLVCWSWNLAANDNGLWKYQYEAFFGNSNSGAKHREHSGEPKYRSVSVSNKKEKIDVNTIEWKEDFKQAYIGNSSRRFPTNRGYCSFCKSVVWVGNNLKCPNEHCGVKSANQQLDPMSLDQIVEHLLENSFSTGSCSDTDSDSDDGLTSKLWALARVY